MCIRDRFLFRYSDDSFSSSFVSTVGIDFKVKTVFQQDKRIKLQIWVAGVLFRHSGSASDEEMYRNIAAHSVYLQMFCGEFSIF